MDRKIDALIKKRKLQNAVLKKILLALDNEKAMNQNESKNISQKGTSTKNK